MQTKNSQSKQHWEVGANWTHWRHDMQKSEGVYDTHKQLLKLLHSKFYWSDIQSLPKICCQDQWSGWKNSVKTSWFTSKVFLVVSCTSCVDNFLWWVPVCKTISKVYRCVASCEWSCGGAEFAKLLMRSLLSTSAHTIDLFGGSTPVPCCFFLILCTRR